MLKENLIVDGQPVKGAIIRDLPGFLDRYYNLRGWNSNGAPTTEKLTALGISWAVK
jgi:aldehyde:ferredoxin oxidoreductase